MAAGKCSGAAGTVTVTALPTATTGTAMAMASPTAMTVIATVTACPTAATASRTTRAATDLPRSTILETVQSNFTSARPTPGKSATTTVPGATITVPVQDPVVTHCPARNPPRLRAPSLPSHCSRRRHHGVQHLGCAVGRGACGQVCAQFVPQLRLHPHHGKACGRQVDLLARLLHPHRVAGQRRTRGLGLGRRGAHLPAHNFAPLTHYGVLHGVGL